MNWHGTHLVIPLYCGGGINNDELDKYVSGYALPFVVAIFQLPRYWLYLTNRPFSMKIFNNLQLLCVDNWEQIQVHTLMIPELNPARQGLIISLKIEMKMSNDFYFISESIVN